MVAKDHQDAMERTNIEAESSGLRQRFAAMHNLPIAERQTELIKLDNETKALIERYNRTVPRRDRIVTDLGGEGTRERVYTSIEALEHAFAQRAVDSDDE